MGPWELGGGLGQVCWLELSNTDLILLLIHSTAVSKHLLYARCPAAHTLDVETGWVGTGSGEGWYRDFDLGKHLSWACGLKEDTLWAETRESQGRAGGESSRCGRQGSVPERPSRWGLGRGTPSWAMELGLFSKGEPFLSQAASRPPGWGRGEGSLRVWVGHRDREPPPTPDAVLLAPTAVPVLPPEPARVGTAV